LTIMTNETFPHDESAVDPAALAAMSPEASEPTPVIPEEPAPAAEATVEAEPAEPAPPSWGDLGLHPDVKLALDDMGYFIPTPVQTAVYKPVSEGKDLMVQSKTGTGKTTAFGLPIINHLIPTHRAPQALILCPTRELALQVSRELTQVGKHRGILVEPVYGGAPIGKQIKALRDGVHIIVGTPGRVLDHIGRRTLDCKTIQTFILDECDEMLSMGFLEDIEKIASYLPEKRQTLLFSATMPDEVMRYARRHMRVPETISLSRDSISVAEIHHAYYIVSGIARSRDLLKIIFAEEPDSAIVFCNTRDETTMVAKFLQKQGLDAEPLSSDLSQADRERVMARSKQKNLRFLVATDVAARGIDISNLSHVINYSVPEQPEIYVHRTGRTGRAGKTGVAISMVGPRELGNFRYIRLQFGLKPEERVLPKDDIFVGKLKVPLPPVGTPQPPDPIQILIRGVQGTPTDLEIKIFEKLYASSAGKRVLARIVAEKLDLLSTRTRPKRERPPREDREPREPREDREQSADGGGEERRERRPYGDREDRERRPYGDRDRGERRFDRGGERGGERGGDRDRERRPFGDRDRDRGDRDRDRSERRDRGDRDRDRGDRDRDRHERRDRPERVTERLEAVPGLEGGDVTTSAAPVEEARPEQREQREHRDYRDRHERRDRPERRDRDRDRDRDRGDRPERTERTERTERIERRDENRDTMVMPPVESAAEIVEEAALETITEVGTEAAPAVEVASEAPPPARVEGERHRGDRKRGKSEPTAETREFWETWAEEKSTRPEPAPAAEADEKPARSERSERSDRGERGEKRGRGKDRDRDERRGGKDRDRDREKKADKPDKHDKTEKADKPDAPRSRRDTAVTPPPSMADAAQARLFVSLGKKHGVTADDLRELLAGPIGGDTSRIGSVSLRDSHAHVRVPEELVEQIIAGVHGTSHNEQEVTVERSRA
jgi:ATP-dependent RNA helicase DeaD